jgi:predicted alpha/beta hydrolase family esterase
MNCIIIHGFGGNAEENWFPWLSRELNSIGIPTIAPDFPNSESPELTAWLLHLVKYQIDEKTILVGHSLGAVLILRFLEQDVKIKAAFFVGVFNHDLGWEALCKSHFFDVPFDWGKIIGNAEHIEVLTSINDQYLTVKDSALVADGLRVKNQVLDVYKHFNMKEFPLIFEKVKRVAIN